MRRFTKQTVQLVLGDGTRFDSPALVLGGLAVHRDHIRLDGLIESVPGRYAITHVRSGMLLMATLSQRRARDLIERLLAVADWNRAPSKLRRLRSVRAIIREYRDRYPEEQFL